MRRLNHLHWLLLTVKQQQLKAPLGCLSGSLSLRLSTDTLWRKFSHLHRWSHSLGHGHQRVLGRSTSKSGALSSGSAPSSTRPSSTMPTLQLTQHKFDHLYQASAHSWRKPQDTWLPSHGSVVFFGVKLAWPPVSKKKHSFLLSAV